MSIGSFTLIKNERQWIKAHIESWLPWLDEMIFYDSSTDGTTEIIRDLMMGHEFGSRIKLFRDKDCANLQDDYVKVFNECLQELSTDYAIFAHPDMFLEYEGNIKFLGDNIAYTVNMRSFAGETDGQLYEIQTGRADKWLHIYRLRNPDLGLHYHGHYGAADEACYFRAITGNKHEYHGSEFDKYPYEVGDSGIVIKHFSDVRPLERRIDRMVKCLINQGESPENAKNLAQFHPRVNFKDTHGFKFVPVDVPVGV